jgi:hypothetical protein
MLKRGKHLLFMVASFMSLTGAVVSAETVETRAPGPCPNLKCGASGGCEYGLGTYCEHVGDSCRTYTCVDT